MQSQPGFTDVPATIAIGYVVYLFKAHARIDSPRRRGRGGIFSPQRRRDLNPRICVATKSLSLRVLRVVAVNSHYERWGGTSGYNESGVSGRRRVRGKDCVPLE